MSSSTPCRGGGTFLSRVRPCTTICTATSRLRAGCFSRSPTVKTPASIPCAHVLGADSYNRIPAVALSFAGFARSRWWKCRDVWRRPRRVRVGAGPVPRGWDGGLLPRGPGIQERRDQGHGDEVDRMVQTAPGDSDPPDRAHTPCHDAILGRVVRLHGTTPLSTLLSLPPLLPLPTGPADDALR